MAQPLIEVGDFRPSKDTWKPPDPRLPLRAIAGGDLHWLCLIGRTILAPIDTRILRTA
jgi:hypothetical protein